MVCRSSDGSHPFYLELKGSSGQANGVYLRNSNGMDIVLDTHSLTYRAIGGQLLIVAHKMDTLALAISFLCSPLLSADQVFSTSISSWVLSQRQLFNSIKRWLGDLICLRELYSFIVADYCLLVARYWGLGFHQCRYGYPNVEALEDVVSKYASNKVTPHIDIHSPTHPPHPLTYLCTDSIGYNVDWHWLHGWGKYITSTKIWQFFYVA